MSYSENVEKAINTAKSFKNNSRQKICDCYNSFLPHPRGYKVKVDSDPLCASFISSIFISLNWTSIVPPECGANELFKNMAAIGRTRKKAEAPAIGDLIFFGSYRADHVGIITDLSNRIITYWDIQSTSVAQHNVMAGSNAIFGFANPDYTSVEIPDPPAEFKSGDLVMIIPGAKWYKGQTIPLNVLADKWKIVQVKNDRAVLGLNEAETRYIQSPIHTKDIQLVSEENEYHVIEITIRTNTLQNLKNKADELQISISQLIDQMFSH